MKRFYLAVATFCLASASSAQTICSGNAGPNLLGAKGTFSAPFITVNNNAENCLRAGSATYNPTNNVGNPLGGCSAATGSMTPCSDYTYTATNNGLNPEFRYSILRTIGDVSGGNCIKGDWRGADHTGDGGYFMAVNGAPNNTFSPVFYQIKSIPVCIGTRYEFSAWVINLLPASSNVATPGSEPNISFKVNGTVIATSGTIAYQNTPTWVKVGGSFIATTSTVDLEVTNATSVALGNDLGLDDISLNVCQSNIAVNGPTNVCDGTPVSLSAVVTDATETNSWYKWQLSTNGGASFTDLTTATQGFFTAGAMTVPYNVGIATGLMQGRRYRLVVATSQSALASPGCANFNEYTLLVQACGPLPVKLAAFTGRIVNGATTQLDWQTSFEQNSERFDLFRSFDGSDFYRIATLASAGNSNVRRDYRYSDAFGATSAPFVYYRLKQVDFNGKETFSPILRLALQSKGKFSLFPNPVNDQLSISFDAPMAGQATLIIRNATGQTLYSKPVAINRGANTLALTQLPAFKPGMHYLSLIGESFQFQEKFIKQ